MKRIILCLSLFVVFGSQAQQINPVPDYVFRNQMSVGRNAVTDTAAYISIGPRYGANKGLMPPIVSDTAAITGVKRNGLLIFSVQRNNFQYWDSINSRWTSVTANVDTTVISTRAWRKKGDDSLGAVIATRTDTTLLSTRAWRKKGDDSLGAVIATRTDTTLLSTRAWRQKGLDSLAAIEIDGSGTVNYVPKFTATRTLGNSQIFDNGTNVGIGTTSPSEKLDVIGFMRTTSGVKVTDGTIDFRLSWASGNVAFFGNTTNHPIDFYTNFAQRLRITSAGELLIGTTTDAGAYALQVAGSIYNTTGAVFAATSGNVTIGATTSPSFSWSGTGQMNIESNIYASSGIMSHSNTSGNYSFWNIGKRRGTLTSPSAVASGETIGDINYVGHDGASYQLAATIRTVIGGTVSSGVVPGDIQFLTENTSGTYALRAIITADGNLGVGTTSPSERLHVNGRVRIATIDSSASPINVLWANASGVIQKTAFPNVIANGSAGRIPKYATATTFDTSLIYQASNEMYINTTSDAGDFKLQVSGNTLVSDGQFRVNANANNGMVLSRSGTNSVVMYTSNTSGIMELGVAGATGGTGTGYTGYAGYLMTEAAYPLQFGSVDTMRMTLNTAGELLISTSTTDNGNYKLQVDGNVWSTGSITTGDPTSGTKKPWKLGSVVGTSVQLDTGNYVEVEINGTFYRLALVTPL